MINNLLLNSGNFIKFTLQTYVIYNKMYFDKYVRII